MMGKLQESLDVKVLMDLSLSLHSDCTDALKDSLEAVL